MNVDATPTHLLGQLKTCVLEAGFGLSVWFWRYSSQSTADPPGLRAPPAIHLTISTRTFLVLFTSQTTRSSAQSTEKQF